MTKTSNLYNHFLSNPIAKPPCRMTNAHMYGFFAEIDLNKVQAYIDSTLNTVANNELHFKAISEYALITFTDIEKIASLTLPYSQHGWMQETDIIIWLPVAEIVKQGIEEDISHLYWYPAFICVNNIYALINGRETWGYNKYLCDYEMPSPINHDGNFSLSLSCFKDFSITEELQTHQLLSINTVQRKPDESLLDKLDSFTERVAKLFVNPNIGVDMALLLQLLEGSCAPSNGPNSF